MHPYPLQQTASSAAPTHKQHSTCHTSAQPRHPAGVGAMPMVSHGPIHYPQLRLGQGILCLASRVPNPPGPQDLQHQFAATTTPLAALGLFHERAVASSVHASPFHPAVAVLLVLVVPTCHCAAATAFSAAAGSACLLPPSAATVTLLSYCLCQHAATIPAGTRTTPLSLWPRRLLPHSGAIHSLGTSVRCRYPRRRWSQLLPLSVPLCPCRSLPLCPTARISAPPLTRWCRRQHLVPAPVILLLLLGSIRSTAPANCAAAAPAGADARPLSRSPRVVLYPSSYPGPSERNAADHMHRFGRHQCGCQSLVPVSAPVALPLCPTALINAPSQPLPAPAPTPLSLSHPWCSLHCRSRLVRRCRPRRRGRQSLVPVPLVVLYLSPLWSSLH